MNDWLSVLKVVNIKPIVGGDFIKTFEEAFTHRSIDKAGGNNNERLEFLGDAVLELVITELLFENFPRKKEGELTNFRSALVRKENLAEVARVLNLGKYLKMSKGEEHSGGRNKDYLLANTMEAFIGAIFVCYDLKTCKLVITDFVWVRLQDILKENKHIDAKSELQEITQGDLRVTPNYKIISEKGLDHNKTFEIGVYLHDKKVGNGVGNSKKEAQLSAAADALSRRSSWE
jgi:ribonuclease-3